MKIRAEATLPDEMKRRLAKARRLQWWMLGLMTGVVVMFYFVLGGSQAMKTAWVEDILSLVPPIAFLIAVRVEQRPPDEKFPFGQRRSISIAYLVSSVALLGMGAFLIVDAGSKLVSGDHPTIGVVELFGVPLWLGWLMILALAISIVPPVILGRKMAPLAKELHDKSLHAGAEMAKADWMTGAGAAVGIVGIGFGLWWADAAAALLISLDIVRDGGANTLRAINDLSDQTPTEVEQERPDPVLEKLAKALDAETWIESYELQLREEGRFLTGVVFVSPTPGQVDRLADMSDLAERLGGLDWRLYDLALAPRPPDPEDRARRERG